MLLNVGHIGKWAASGIMERKPQRLSQLIDLASEPSSERRRELMREITDVFLDDPHSYSERENWYFGDILSKVAYDLEVEMRQELASRLSAESAAPPELIGRLARDEIEVARPVIEHSPVLTQDDLVEIAQEKGQDHMLAITKRNDIGERVSTVLVDRGNENVVIGLVENLTAAISDGSFRTVVDRAESSETLKASLMKRPDLPYELMQSMIAQLSVDIREKVLAEDTDQDREQVEVAMKEVTASQQTKLEQRKYQESEPEALVNDLVAKNQLTPHKLITFAQEQRVPEFVCALGKLANIDLEMAEKVTMDRSGEGLALTCRAGGLPANLFAEMMVALGPSMQKTDQEVDQLVQTYEKLAVPTAQRILRFWRVRKTVSTESAA